MGGELLRLIGAVLLLTALPAWAETQYRQIVIGRGAHPAAMTAAQMIGKALQMPVSAIRRSNDDIPHRGEIVLAYGHPTSRQAHLLRGKAGHIRNDGYVIVFDRVGVLIFGARPRSLLYAAGDLHLWKDERTGVYVREPDFALRTGEYDPNLSVADYVARLGVNLIIEKRGALPMTLQHTFPEVYAKLTPEERAKLERQRADGAEKNREFVQECHDADVPVYAFLYGNNFRVWSPVLYKAVIETSPSAQGVPSDRSFEQDTLSPADPQTWRAIRAFVGDFMDYTAADGLYATFWDRYGIYCTDQRCQDAHVSTFRDQLYECVKQYYEALHALNKGLVVRTWASGSPHWLRGEYMHAPGYGNFGGSAQDVWGRVIHELPKDIVIQTKVYYSDCEPDARLNPLIGKAVPHPEIVEYQVSGQFVGRFYFPASSVNYMATTMQQAHDLVGESGGVNIFPGGTMQSNYSVFDDIINSINVYAWRELSWNTHADVQKIWLDWATTIYGPQAAPHIVKALQLSEPIVDRTFSTLGFGSSTNSDFAGSIDRRETLLRYTNRYYLPEYAKYLEPTQENIERVVAEKNEVDQEVAAMMSDLDKARPYLSPNQTQELTTRFAWLKEFTIVNNALEESLWRYRRLRYLDSMLTTDPAQLRFLAHASATVQQHAHELFRFDPSQKFSCYSTPLGELRIRPGLGNPLPLMRELYSKSKALVENSAGPDDRANERTATSGVAQ